jgi:hypothetical protein
MSYNLRIGAEARRHCYRDIRKLKSIQGIELMMTFGGEFWLMSWM